MCRSQSPSSMSTSRARRNSCASTWLAGEAVIRGKIAALLTIAVAPKVPPSFAAVGYSASVPSRPANCSRNSPSRGESGITTRRGIGCRTPATPASGIAARPAPGTLADSMSCTMSAIAVSRSSSGRTRARSLCTPRKVYDLPLAPRRAKPRVWRLPTTISGLRPPASFSRSSTGTSIGIVQRSR